MVKTMRCPQYFVVGAGACAEVGRHGKELGGSRALVIGGARSIEAVKGVLLPSLEAAGISFHVESGEHVRKTLSSVDALTAVGRKEGADLLIGCGGGAVMDCGKAVAHELKVPYIAVPTVASVNAAGTNSATIEGDSVPRRYWYQAVDVIVADTAIIAAAGARFLASGMGDALPSGYGAQLALWRGRSEATATRVALAQLCTRTILEEGARAYRACKRGVPVPELDRVVEAIILCSGLAGFGMPGDHVLHPAQMPQCRRRAIHGEWVAFGFLVRLVLGGEFNSELPGLVRFLRSVELPTRLADFGLEGITKEDLLEECQRIVGPSGKAEYDLGRPVTAEEICEAMLEVDCLSRALPQDLDEEQASCS